MKHKNDMAELQTEIGLYRDGESHIMDVKLSPKFVKSIIRTINSEIKNLKKELRFTDKEIDFIKKSHIDGNSRLRN